MARPSKKSAAQIQLSLANSSSIKLSRPKEEIISDVHKLLVAWKTGLLGGEIMPEDVHPNLPKDSKELAHYFTLGMALNYQRNSYSLWKSCTQTFLNPETAWVFDPHSVASKDIQDLKLALLRYKVALQPQNHPSIWYRICKTLVEKFNGDVRNLFQAANREIAAIKSLIQTHKPGFPYLSGVKIVNYWLFVMLNYTNHELQGKADLNIAPDTHVIAASQHLGVITQDDINKPDLREHVARRWLQILQGTNLDPIDIHTPLWLWSRKGFIPLQ